MNRKRNQFLIGALEEMSQTAGVQTAPQPAFTQTNVDDDTDAVAVLMEKNNELENSNATLEGENFDNDVTTIQTTSDSVGKDLDEAVQAGVALEQLAYIIDLAIKNDQVTPAANAGFAHALEQYSAFGGLKNPMPALEAEALQLDGPKDQAESIGETAKNKAAEISKKLLEGLKRLMGWAWNLVRSMFARTEALAKKAKELVGQLDSIDESKTIDAGPFIASLRLVEGGGDPNKQFKEYGEMSAKAVYGFFNNSFTNAYDSAITELKNSNPDGKDRSRVTVKLIEIIKTLMSALYPENGTSGDIGGVPEKISDRDLTVALTKPCIGGLQLAVAATLDNQGTKENWFCKSGPAKNQPAIDTPASIPVVDKRMARDYLGLIQQWMRDQKILEENVRVYQSVAFTGKFVYSSVLNQFLSVITAIMTGCLPYMLRLNIQNSANFIAYVERSIAVSKSSATPEKK